MEKFRDNSFFDDLSDAFFSVTSPRYDKTVLKRIFFVTFVALLLFIIQYGFPQNLTLSQFADLPVKLILTVILLTFVILYFVSFISGYIVITLFYAVEFIAFSFFGLPGGGRALRRRRTILKIYRKIQYRNCKQK